MGDDDDRSLFSTERGEDGDWGVRLGKSGKSWFGMGSRHTA